MKKLVLIFIIGLCAFPALAQRRVLSGWTAWTGRPGWTGLRKSATEAPRVAGNVEQGITRALVKVQPPMATHIQITNLPDQPFVKLGTPLPVTDGVPGNPFPVLKARVMSGDENFRRLLRPTKSVLNIYVPVALNTQEESGYRGLKLYGLYSVQNILKEGLEWKEASSDMNGRMYFSGGVYRAAGYITESNSQHVEIPTLVRFTIPPNKENIYARSSIFAFDYYYFLRNIPARHIQDVMVFLEVGGKPGWYKVTLENGELVFTPAQSQVFKWSELIEHNLNIPERNIEEMW